MPKPTYGEKKRLTEKEKYRVLAEANPFETHANRLRAIPVQLDEETQISPETRAVLNLIADQLVELNAVWKEYSTAYLDVSRTKDAENLKERRSMRMLLDGFNKISQQMEAFQNEKNPVEERKVAERKEFVECLAEVKNIAGHYHEMVSGSLVVPEMTEEQKSKIITTKKELNIASQSIFDGLELLTSAEGVYRSKLGFVDRFDTPLFSHEPTPEDIMQGTLGDCYFMAALSSVAANNPQMIRDMMKDNGDGTVTVRLYDEKKNGKLEPIYVNVEKSVPVIKRHKTDGSQSEYDIYAKGALWVQILEKAFAASNIHRSSTYKRFSETIRSYTDIKGGSGSKAFRVLFGRQNIEMREITIHKDYSNTENPKVMDNLFKKIREGVVDNHVMTTSAGKKYIGKKLLEDYKRDVETGITNAGKPLSKEELNAVREKVASKLFCGVMFSIDEKSGLPEFHPHVYTLIDAYEKGGKKYVLVRNPHADMGYKEENGATKEDKGYCEIPLKTYAGMFGFIDMAKPLEPKNYQDFSSEYHKPLSKLYQGFLNTTTHSSTIMQWLSLSKESWHLKNALREIEKIQEQKFPSKHAMMEAYKELDKAAKAYLEKHKDDSVADMKDETNRRITIAKASMALAGSFLGHLEKERDVKADIHRIGSMMVTERGVFVAQKVSNREKVDPKAQSIFTDARVKKSLMPIDGDKLFDIAFEKQAHKIPSEVLGELAKVAKEKQEKTTVQKEEVKENVKQIENVLKR